MKKTLIIAIIILSIICLLAIIFLSSKLISNNALSAKVVNNNNKELAGKKIIYIDSYHSGYEWSDGIENGIKQGLKDTGIELKIHKMDTKKNPSEEFKIQAGIKAKQAIEEFKPDLIIASDDNAFKYLIKDYYKDSNIPVVFCGLNWDASLYGAPYSNTAGMIEVALIPDLIVYLRTYAKGDKIGFLSDDTETARKEADYPEKFFNLTFERRFVKNFSDWKIRFLELQDKADMLYFHNNAGIKDWNETEAKKFAKENTKIPTGAIYTWIMPYSLIGLTNDPSEQGEWSAETAIKILKGTDPKDIPLAYNKKGELNINLQIADRLGVVFPPSMLKNAKIISDS
jgi:ABC-type uncharacterized transport system substrate-binding protein